MTVVLGEVFRPGGDELLEVADSLQNAVESRENILACQEPTHLRGRRKHITTTLSLILSPSYQTFITTTRPHSPNDQRGHCLPYCSMFPAQESSVSVLTANQLLHNEAAPLHRGYSHSSYLLLLQTLVSILKEGSI